MARQPLTRRRHSLNIVTSSLVSLLVASIAIEARASSAQADIDLLGTASGSVQLEAIARLSKSADASAFPPIAALLQEEPADPDTREALWYRSCLALSQLAWVSPFDRSVRDHLVELSERHATVMTTDYESFRVPREVPQYPFPRAARTAYQAMNRMEANRRFAAEAATRQGNRRIFYTAKVAWTTPEDAELPIWLPAREALAGHGKRGVAASLSEVPNATLSSRREMVAYFAEHAATGDSQEAVEGLLSLSLSPEDIVWGSALSAIGDQRASAAVQPLIDRLRGDAVANTDRNRMTLETLGRIGDDTSLDFLTLQLANGERQMAAQAGSALARSGTAGVTRLESATADGRPDVRKAALTALLTFDTPDARAALQSFSSRPGADPEEKAWVRGQLAP